MKKNKMMRLASSLLVAVLLTTSVISGTFAKYVTAGEATDTARVAAWGVEVTVTGDEALFGTMYGTDNKVTTTENGATVKSVDKVIAPGTTGSLSDITIEGTTEVSVEVVTDATLVLSGWTVNGNLYCPLTIKVGETTFNALDYNDLDKFIEDVLAEVEVTKTYAPGVELSENNRTISWSWPIENATGDEYIQDNAKDTLLGKANPAPTISFSVTVSVTQVD